MMLPTHAFLARDPILDTADTDAGRPETMSCAECLNKERTLPSHPHPDTAVVASCGRRNLLAGAGGLRRLHHMRCAFFAHGAMQRLHR